MSTPEYPESFRHALDLTLSYEGGYFAEEVTNYGIMQPTYDAYRRSKGLKPRHVLKMTREEVEGCYYDRYFYVHRLDTLPDVVALVYFDTGVNFGMSYASKIYKIAARDSGTAHQIALAMVDARIAKRYDIVRRNPAKKKFLKGWLRRDRALRREVLKHPGV